MELLAKAGGGGGDQQRPRTTMGIELLVTAFLAGIRKLDIIGEKENPTLVLRAQLFPRTIQDFSAGPSCPLRTTSTSHNSDSTEQ